MSEETEEGETTVEEEVMEEAVEESERMVEESLEEAEEQEALEQEERARDEALAEELEREPPKPLRFTLGLKQAEWTQILKALQTVVDEAVFSVDGERLHLRAMDPSRVCMVDFECPRNFFEDYSLENEGSFCVNLEWLSKTVKQADKDEVVALTLNPEVGRFIVSTIDEQFTLPILEVMEEGEPPTPKIEWKAEATLVTKGIRKALASMTLASDHTRITAYGDSLTFEAKGDFLTAKKVFRKIVSEDLLNIEAKEPTHAMYSLSYLNDIVKSASGDVVRLKYASDMPIEVSYDITGQIMFYLAPRIEVE